MRDLLLAVAACVCSSSAVASYPDIVPCPKTFHQIAIPDNARQCQQFDDAVSNAGEEQAPSSLVFFLPQPTQHTVEQLRSMLPSLGNASAILARTAMQTPDGKIKVVVSPDNNGSQVDILVFP